MLEYTIDPNQPGFAPEVSPEVTRTSTLAVWALSLGIAGLVFLCCGCPLVSLAAVVVGAIGALCIGRDPSVKGRGLAIFGLVLGVVGCALAVVVGWFGWTKIYAPMFRLPSEAMSAIAADDVDAFRDLFTPPGSTADDEVVLAYFALVEAEYGTPSHAALDQQRQSIATPALSEAINLPWLFVFDGQNVGGYVAMEFANQRTGELRVRIRSLSIGSPPGAVLTFPPESGSTSPPAPTDHPEPSGS